MKIYTGVVRRIDDGIAFVDIIDNGEVIVEGEFPAEDFKDIPRRFQMTIEPLPDLPPRELDKTFLDILNSIESDLPEND